MLPQFTKEYKLYYLLVLFMWGHGDYWTTQLKVWGNYVLSFWYDLFYKFPYENLPDERVLLLVISAVSQVTSIELSKCNTVEK